MIRRFLNVVAENYKTGVYSLHRVDLSKHLFHQTRTEAQVVPLLAQAQGNTAAADSPRILESLQDLPAPYLKLHPSVSGRRYSPTMTFFGLLSPLSSENQVLSLSWAGDAILCDADTQIIYDMPNFEDEVADDPISFSVVRPDSQGRKEEDLYVIHKAPDPRDRSSCFRVLVGSGGTDWRWESLPPPPYVDDPWYEPAFIYSYTVVDGGRTICVSCASEGTYCFDTVERQWRHVGDWVLPFEGSAEYVPDLKLWLGLSPCTPHFCLCATSDLNAIAVDEPPKLQYVWQDLVTPQNWSSTSTNLISLGSGRFCIVKAFEVPTRCRGKSGDYYHVDGDVAVLTGVQVVKGSDEQPEVLRHRSIVYSPADCRILWVL